MGGGGERERDGGEREREGGREGGREREWRGGRGGSGRKGVYVIVYTIMNMPIAM